MLSYSKSRIYKFFWHFYNRAGVERYHRTTFRTYRIVTVRMRRNFVVRHVATHDGGTGNDIFCF